MNHKYINSETFEIMNNIIEVDEAIAETISILNKKGYYTKYCCSGHVKDPRLYELYKEKSLEDFKGDLGYIISNKNGEYDILIPYTYTYIYIMFKENINFNILPEGFKLNGKNLIEMKIDYYSNGKRKSSNDIDKELKIANKVLLNWALSLPKL